MHWCELRVIVGCTPVKTEVIIFSSDGFHGNWKQNGRQIYAFSMFKLYLTDLIMQMKFKINDI